MSSLFTVHYGHRLPVKTTGWNSQLFKTGETENKAHLGGPHRQGACQRYVRKLRSSWDIWRVTTPNRCDARLKSTEKSIITGIYFICLWLMGRLQQHSKAGNYHAKNASSPVKQKSLGFSLCHVWVIWWFLFLKIWTDFWHVIMYICESF